MHVVYSYWLTMNLFSLIIYRMFRCHVSVAFKPKSSSIILLFKHNTKSCFVVVLSVTSLRTEIPVYTFLFVEDFLVILFACWGTKIIRSRVKVTKAIIGPCREIPTYSLPWNVSDPPLLLGAGWWECVGHIRSVITTQLRQIPERCDDMWSFLLCVHLAAVTQVVPRIHKPPLHNKRILCILLFIPSYPTPTRHAST